MRIHANASRSFRKGAAQCRTACLRRPYITKTLLVMKLTFLLLTAAFLNVSASGISQTVTFAGVNVPLEKVFTEVKIQTRFVFFYDEEILKGAKPVTVKANNLLLEKFLDNILQEQSLKYKIEGKNIIISRRTQTPGLNPGTPSLLSPSPIDIKGKIVNENGEPLVGVSITFKGTNIGTTTDADGKYSIIIPRNGALVFSSVGFVTQEVAINSSATIDIRMQEEATSLNQVVVTALGIKRESKSLTYSTQGVNAQQLKEVREPNVMVSLQGKVAGLSITESGGGLGSPARVVLRGNRSISGDSQPLYVVDGVPINGDPTNLSSDNIASINVLKGPNAAALYGSAAQNGAIIITTYTGSAGVTNVSFSSSYITQRPIMTAKFQNEYGQGTGGIYNKRSDLSWGPKMEGQKVEDWSPDPEQQGKTYALTPQPDNVKDFFAPGRNLVNNLLINLGGEKTQTVFSFTRTDAKGMVPNNELKRNNIAVRVNSKLSSKLSLDAKIDYTNQQNIGGINAQGSFESSIANLYTIPRSIQIDQMRRFEYKDLEGANRQNYWSPGSAFDQNPYWRVYRNESTGTYERVIALASLKYDFSRAINLMVRGAYDGTNGSNQNKTYNDTYNRGRYGRYSVGFNNGLLFNTDFLLSYKKNINADWSLDANLGGNIRQNRNSGLNSNTGPAMTVPNFFALSNTQQVVSTYEPGNSLDVYSLYAFTHIGWKNAMFLDVTGRNDWSWQSLLFLSIGWIERSTFRPDSFHTRSIILCKDPRIMGPGG